MKKEHKSLIENIGGVVCGLGASIFILRVDKFVRPAFHFFLGDLCVTVFAALSGILTYGVGCAFIKDVISGVESKTKKSKYTSASRPYSYGGKPKYSYSTSEHDRKTSSFWSKMSATKNNFDDDFDENEFGNDGIYDFTAPENFNKHSETKESK